MSSFKRVAQRAWKKTKNIQDVTMNNLKAKSRLFRSSINEKMYPLSFSHRLMQWRKRSDVRGVASRFIMASMPSLISTDKIKLYDKSSYYLQREKMSNRKIKAQWYKIIRYLGNAKSSNNCVHVYSNGSEVFSSMWSSIKNAKHRIWMQTYILKPDTIGFRTIEELTNAARRGVQVTFIYDHLGSLGFSDAHFEQLRAANGVALCFNDPSSLVNYFSIRGYALFRNHRKILVVDSDCGFCGGMNIAGDYCNEDVGGNGRFRDTHAKVKGPGVLHLAEVFLDTIATMRNSRQLPDFVSKKLEAIDVNLEVPQTSTGCGYEWLDTISNPSGKKKTNNTFLQVLASNSSKNKRGIQKSLSNTIDMAQRHVYLTSPYFLPPFKIRLAIIRAARRGVDVRILTAGKSDILLINSASNHIYGLFLKNNVRIYELYSRELHAKTVTSDGAIAMVGSYNLDNLSYKHNLEATLNIIDPRIAVKLERDFFEDLKEAKEVIRHRWENRSFFAKCWHWLVYTTFTFIMK